MILKHVAAALRRQEWIAVAIEFTLVVTGVLLAFQISEWASERRTRGERQAAVSRLLLEAEESVAYLRASAAKQNQLIVDLDYALGQVERGSWRSGDQPRMTRALLRILNAAPAAPPSSVYDDLIASGTFGNIGELQSQITGQRSRLTRSLSTMCGSGCRNSKDTRPFTTLSLQVNGSAGGSKWIFRRSNATPTCGKPWC